jgi:hypothetical protein
MHEPEPQSTAITPMEMLSRAVERGATIEMVEKLMMLQERWEANQARKAFDAAIADAKAEIPTITKNRKVDFTSQKGRTHYRHEDLGEITNVVAPILGRFGLSFRFTTKTEGKTVAVTCIVSHRDGHFVENTLTGPHDDSGNKNSIQAIGSSITYLQRYTLKAALGLAASDDDDGNAAGGTLPAPQTVTPEQVEELERLLALSETNLEKFLEIAEVESLSQIFGKNFEACRNILIRKARKARAQ